jgi:hypothetical protein
MKTSEWPPLKVLFHFLRLFMPIEFTVVAVAFFDTNWSQAQCQKFYLFEPICTALLLAAASAVHVIRIHAIYDKSRAVLMGMGALFGIQIVATAICCGFYRSVPLDVGQGCIAGPKYTWVGLYWAAPTLLYTVSLALALARSVKSLEIKPLSPWKLMLRDGLNLYAAIWIVNMVNLLFWFIMKADGPSDPIKTIVTSMATVLTTSMTLRIILAVRGPLADGGSFAGSSSATSGSSRATHVISTNRSRDGTNSRSANGTFTLDNLHSKTEGEWPEDGKSSVTESKGAVLGDDSNGNIGVRITVDREVGYDDPYMRSK